MALYKFRIIIIITDDKDYYVDRVVCCRA